MNKDVGQNLNLSNYNIIKLIHQNIQYLSNRKEAIQVFLECTKPNVLVLTEHSLKANEIDQFSLENYTLISSYSRPNYKSGGVAIYTLREVV